MANANKENSVIWLLYLVIIISYYMIFLQYWFLKLTGGFVIRIWIPNLVILFAVFIKYRAIMPSRGPWFIFKTDYASPIFAILIVLALWDGISLFSHDYGMWYIGKHMLVSFSPVCLFFAIVILVRNDTTIYRILALVFFVGVINVLQVEFRDWSGDPSFSALTTSTGVKYEYGEDPCRVVLKHSSDILRHGKEGFGMNTYSRWLMVLPLIGYFMGSRISRRRWKIYYYSSACLIFYGLVVAMTRAAFIGLACGTLMFFLLYSRLWSRKKVLRVAAIYIFLAAVMIHNYPGVTIRMLRLAYAIPILSHSSYIKNKLLDYGMHPGHLGSGGGWEDPHLSRFGDSFELFSKSPIFGVGWIKQYQINEHNWFIQQLVIYGGVSFVLIIILNAAIAFRIWKVLRKELFRDPANAELGILLFSCVIAAQVYLNASPGENSNIWIIFALGIAWTRNTYKKQQAYIKPRG